jgi:ankyrin repeat protein
MDDEGDIYDTSLFIELLRTGVVEYTMQAIYHSTLLHKAVTSYNNRLLQFLCASGKIDIDSTDGFNCTPLRLATEYRDINAMSILLKHGANPDLAPGNVPAPLFYASCADSFKLLIQAGADPTVRNHHGVTPLHLAAARMEYGTVEMLLWAGADPSALDEMGRTALHFASAKRSKDVIDLLIEWGIPVDAKDKDGNTATVNALTYCTRVAEHLIITYGQSESLVIAYPGQSELAAAVEWGESPRVVKFLLCNGADPFTADVTDCPDEMICQLVMGARKPWTPRNHLTCCYSMHQRNQNYQIAFAYTGMASVGVHPFPLELLFLIMSFTPVIFLP